MDTTYGNVAVTNTPGAITATLAGAALSAIAVTPDVGAAHERLGAALASAVQMTHSHIDVHHLSVSLHVEWDDEYETETVYRTAFATAGLLETADALRPLGVVPEAHVDSTSVTLRIPELDRAGAIVTVTAPVDDPDDMRDLVEDLYAQVRELIEAIKAAMLKR